MQLLILQGGDCVTGTGRFLHKHIKHSIKSWWLLKMCLFLRFKKKCTYLYIKYVARLVPLFFKGSWLDTPYLQCGWYLILTPEQSSGLTTAGHNEKSLDEEDKQRHKRESHIIEMTRQVWLNTSPLLDSSFSCLLNGSPQSIFTQLLFTVFFVFAAAAQVSRRSGPIQPCSRGVFGNVSGMHY